jgi:hypothetical protein
LARVRLVDAGVVRLGFDAAVVTRGAASSYLENLQDDAGLRGLVPPLGQSNNLSWLHVASNPGYQVRTSATAPGTPRPGEGFEAHIPWRDLFADTGGVVPPGTTVGVFCVLVNSDGTWVSNQALPAFAQATGPADGRFAPAAVVRFLVDTNHDGVPDDPSQPSLVTP